MADTMASLCTLCYSKYSVKHPSKIPRRLQCEHTFCNECVEKLSDLQGQAIECPLCQEPTLLPSKGVDGLVKNLEALGLDRIETEPEKCQHCIHKVYPPKPATLFCHDCEASFCGNCCDTEHLKPENARHSITLESAKSSDKFAGGSSVFSRQLNSSWNRPTTGSRSDWSSSTGQTLRSSSSLILEQDAIPECPEHGEKMKIYCRTDRCLCCAYCETVGVHRGHDCFKVHEAEEKERVALQKLQQKVDLHSERFIKARGDVQQMIEDVKKNSIGVKDTVRGYLREMRAAIDATEKTLLAQLAKRSEANLKALREQLSKMINISSLAKTASRNCDNALSYDYYEMLLRRRAIEEEMKNVLEMMVATEPVAKANLHCQFPKHETLLNSIRTCSYIVEAPPAPSNFTCSLAQEGNIQLSWDDNDDMQFIYPPMRYIIQASIGPDTSFVDVKNTKMKYHTFGPNELSYVKGEYVQFRVCAENIVEKGPFCNPFGIKIAMSSHR